VEVVKMPITLPEWQSLRVKPEREPGIHVSSVIRFIQEKLGNTRESDWNLKTTWRIGSTGQTWRCTWGLFRWTASG